MFPIVGQTAGPNGLTLFREPVGAREVTTLETPGTSAIDKHKWFAILLANAF